MSITRKVGLASAAATIALGVGAASASAATYSVANESGAAIANGTAFSATASNFQLTNSATGAAVATCTSATLSGTVNTSTTPPRLDITGPTGAGVAFNSCTTAGTPVWAVPNFPWALSPVSGTGSGAGATFGGKLASPTGGSFSANLKCGGANTGPYPTTYTGQLTTGLSLKNVSGGSQVVLANAGALTKGGTGCAALPTSAGFTGTFTLTSLGGTAVSSTNNLYVTGTP